ncbi:hypothetical protein M426DRAFT_58064 [Hypoxylon sp. CI-4A]|nr:hypothetical protein M426DRAFT_58064 [Hypoxylon sp. CI-4A]
MRSVKAAGLLAALSGQTTAQTTSSFNWTSIIPSTSLNYTTCYDTLKCAKLSVPLDWLNNSTTTTTTTTSNSTTTQQISLAIIALPATVPETDPSFGGTIIVNPGGPGGSGVEYVLASGPTLQAIADDTKHYEILSFDPRGTGFSEPGADCFRGDEFGRALAAYEMRVAGPLDAGVDVVRRQAGLYGAWGRLCEEGGPEQIRGFMSTASVARDMLEIVEKIDDEVRGGGGRNGTASANARRQSGKDLPRIQYWGVSYGTVLGNYFASMFPGRVGRMMLEGVVDVHDYNAGLWSKNLQDADKVFDTFWTTCFEAGSACAVYKPNDTSPNDIRKRFETFLDELTDSPAQIVSGTTIDEITRADVLVAILQALYGPLDTFPVMADLLSSAMAGNYSVLAAGSLQEPSCSSSSPVASTAYTWISDALGAVACGDAEVQDLSTSELNAYVSELKAQTPYFAPTWATIRLQCNGWRVRPRYRFAGPFTTPAADPALVEGRPVAPILFLSSALDPVTPRRNAVAMAREHTGAGVLVQNSTGHATLNVPGKCRDGYVSRYFETGELPPEDTVCEPDCSPFRECRRDTLAKRAVSLPGFLPKKKKGPLELW